MYKLIASAAEDKNPKAGKEADLWTPLHCAAKNGHFQIVEFICSVVKEINPKDAKGKTPHNIAQLNGWEEICDLFKYIWLNGWHPIPNYFFSVVE